MDILTFNSIFSAILVITSRSPIISVLFLISVFINVSGYLILLGINFIAISYIMIYIGAIAILFLFVIMMLNVRLTHINQVGVEYSKNVPLAIMIAFSLNYLMVSNINISKLDSINIITALFDYINNLFLGINNSSNDLNTIFNFNYTNIFVNYEQIQSIGAIMYSNYALYLVLASFILLIAMIGPIILTLDSKKSNTPHKLLANSFNRVKRPFNNILFYLFLLFIIIVLLGELLQSLFSKIDTLLTCFVPIMIYSNADMAKSQILSDNKGKAGIYLWTHLESGKIYVGSAVNLSLRLRDYFNKGFLTQRKSSYINNALLHHRYSAFSLTIYEYVNISHLPKDEARKLILEREQLYIDTLLPDYNLLKIAGSSLGHKHSEETKAILSEINKGENHPMFGRKHSPETKALISKNHTRGMLGRTHSLKSKALMSEARKGENHPNFGKYKKIFIYFLDSGSKSFILHKSFDNSLEASLYLNCSRQHYLDI